MSSSLSATTVTTTSLTTDTLTLPSSFITSYTPIVTVGTNLTTDGTATGYRMTFGSLKLVFGEIPLRWSTGATSSGTTTVTLPSSFFSSVLVYVPSISSVGNTAVQYVNGDGATTSTVKFYCSAPSSTVTVTTLKITFLVIGT